MKKVISLLYTIIIPVIPLGLHMFIDILTNTKTELRYIYPELFFATVTICIESFKTLHDRLKYNDSKGLMQLILVIFFVVSSTAYGGILVTNNLSVDVFNVQVALSASLIVFIGSIFMYTTIIILKEA